MTMKTDAAYVAILDKSGLVRSACPDVGDHRRAHQRQAETLRRSARAQCVADGGRQYDHSQARHRRPRHGRRELPRRADPSGICGMREVARHRRRQADDRRRPPRFRARTHHQRRGILQELRRRDRGAAARSGLQGAAHGAAGVDLLERLDEISLFDHRLEHAPARRSGPGARLPHRPGLEREAPMQLDLRRQSSEKALAIPDRRRARSS